MSATRCIPTYLSVRGCAAENHSKNRARQRPGTWKPTAFDGFDDFAEGFFSRGTLTVGDYGKRAINETTGSPEAGNATTTFN
jgi:hypothetical protein